MLMPRLLLLAAALSLPVEALALSCLKPNLARDFNDRAADTKTYMFVEGQFIAEYSLSDTLRQPPPKPGQPPAPRDELVRAEAHFVGRHLGATTEAPLNQRVKLTVTCSTPWCGSFPPERTPLIGFLERKGDGSLAFHAGLCPSGLQERPTAQQVQTIRRCLGRGSCGATDLAVFD